jgi:hypothetical protein
VQEVLGPGDELAGVGGVGPDLGDLRVHEAKPPEHLDLSGVELEVITPGGSRCSPHGARWARVWTPART